MEDRLKLAKKLLNPDDSILIVAIDEKEYLRLGLLLEQLFPAAEIDMVSTVINPAGVSREGRFSRSNEYLYFVYLGSGSIAKLELEDEWIGNIKNRARKETLRWNTLLRSGTSAERKDRPNCFYPIYVDAEGKKIHSVGEPYYGENRFEVIPPDGTVAIWPIRKNGNEGRWQVTVENLLPLISKGYVRLGKFNGRGTMAIDYLKKGEITKVENGTFPIVGYAEDGSIRIDSNQYRPKFYASTTWNIPSHDATQNGTKLISQMIPGREFPFPKSLYAVEDALRFAVADKKDAVVVDFFSGSGTTAHALMRLNQSDGGLRTSISITNNEISSQDQRAFVKDGLRQGDPHWEAHGICRYITEPRIVSAITGRTPEGAVIEGSYRFGNEEDMASGYEENAVFYDLEYLEPSVISADMAYEDIAPLLWMCGGCRGEVLDNNGTYQIGETYAVLFDPRYMRQFVEAVKPNDQLRAVFIVTDDSERYRSLCSKLKHHNVRQLYSSYLRNFEINAIG
jgi:adenine-specific DNA-methyltransferase